MKLTNKTTEQIWSRCRCEHEKRMMGRGRGRWESEAKIIIDVVQLLMVLDSAAFIWA